MGKAVEGKEGIREVHQGAALHNNNDLPGSHRQANKYYN